MPELVDVEPGSPEWLAARREGVTATDIPVICGLTAGNTPWALWQRKTGALPPVEANARMRLGTILEPYVAGQWAERHPEVEVWGGSLMRSDERPWQMATLDRVLGRIPAEILGTLELKTSGTFDGWGEDGTAEVPVHVRAQVLWQMDVMGVGRGHVACLFLPSGELQSYVIEHDESPLPEYPHDVPGPIWDDCRACADLKAMRDAGRDFMDLLNMGTPPPVDGSAVTLAALKARWAPVMPETTAEVNSGLVENWEYHLDMAAKYKQAAKTLEAEIRDQAKEASEWTVNGEVVARRLRYPVKAHMRKASMVDKIIRVKAKEEDDNGE